MGDGGDTGKLRRLAESATLCAEDNWRVQAFRVAATPRVVLRLMAERDEVAAEAARQCAGWASQIEAGRERVDKLTAGRDAALDRVRTLESELADARRLLREQPQWTRERPTVTGLYWLRREDEAQVVEVAQWCTGHGLCVWRIGHEAERDLSYFAGAEWLGPLPVPV